MIKEQKQGIRAKRRKKTMKELQPPVIIADNKKLLKLEIYER